MTARRHVPSLPRRLTSALCGLLVMALVLVLPGASSTVPTTAQAARAISLVLGQNGSWAPQSSPASRYSCTGQFSPPCDEVPTMPGKKYVTSLCWHCQLPVGRIVSIPAAGSSGGAVTRIMRERAAYVQTTATQAGGDTIVSFQIDNVIDGYTPTTLHWWQNLAIRIIHCPTCIGGLLNTMLPYRSHQEWRYAVDRAGHVRFLGYTGPLHPIS